MVLFRFPAGLLDGLLEKEDVLPCLPGVTLCHHPVAAVLAGVYRIDIDGFDEGAMRLVVLVLQHAREVLEYVDPFRSATDIRGRDRLDGAGDGVHRHVLFQPHRSEEHTSELQSLMRISYAVFCLKKKNTK